MGARGLKTRSVGGSMLGCAMYCTLHYGFEADYIAL